MDEELQSDLQDVNDDSFTPGSHNKLLGAISELYDKKRVKAPTRKEPSLEVSEFHLSKPDKKHGRIKVAELAKVLNKRATHADISQKLKNAQQRAKTLPKPLEKIYQDKINRKAGYEQAKQQLNRWDAIVYKQQVAEQLSFPLKSEDIKIHETADVSTLFRKPTELEIELGKVLNQPNPFADKKEEKKQNKNEGDFPLTLAEIIEKRNMMAKLRARQSYQQAKAARHSKIKSKKFHQIQRRARVKEQLREFEELQKKDPEAALKKLEELERTRAEERVTLRHRSTGQWAKNLAVRAKYDKDARIALAEQLSKSRELTVKLGKSQESDSDKEEEWEEEENQTKPEEDPDNPWVMKQSKDMEDFVSGYRKYWESQGKEQEKLHNQDTAVKVKTYQQETDKIVVEDTAVKVNTDQQETETVVDDTENTASENSHLINGAFHKADENESNDVNVKHEDKQKPPNKINESLNKNPSTVEENSIDISPNLNGINKNKLNSSFVEENSTNISLKQNGIVENKLNSSFNISHSSSKKKNKEKSLICNISSELNCSWGSWIVSDKHDKTITKVSSPVKNKLSRFSNSFEVTESNKIVDSCCEGPPGDTANDRPRSRREKSLDELFEEVEDRLQDRVKGKIVNIKNKININRKIEDENENGSEQEEIPSLQFKKRPAHSDVDEELIQQTKDECEGSQKNDLSKTIKTATAEVKQTENIDPNKFLKVTPRHLLSQVPEIMTEGEDALDDEEKVAEDRHLTICEAFADDDVVDQFQKEKTEEAKKSRIGNVDLSLPGWGSWAGHNMQPLPRRKRKKFVIKFPKAVPRRDSNRGNVIINEDADKPIKEHQVSEVPFPFTSVEEYEASIRAPLGTTWMPQTAHAKLTLPPVVTKMGAIIAPMDESQLVSKDESKNMNRKKIKTTSRKKTQNKIN